MNQLINLLEKTEGLIRKVKKNLLRSNDLQFKQVEQWYAEDPHGLKKSTFEFLSLDSIVFDLGGYEGQWSSDIFARYSCNIYIFEPVKQYAELIQNRFRHNDKIHTYPFGLAEKNSTATIKIDLFASRVINDSSDTSNTEKIELKEFNNFIAENGIKRIELIKINIEGAEYSLLRHLIETGTIHSVQALLIQFHNFVDNASNLRQQLQNDLAITHQKVFDYPFVWELWIKK